MDLNRIGDRVICCMWNDGWQVAKHLNGIGRVIWYQDTQNKGAQAEFAWRIWEGQIQGGRPDGFSRLIGGKADFSFVGYMSRINKTKKGTGMFFQKRALKYQGIYADDQDYYTVQPTEPVIFGDFSAEFVNSECGEREILKISGKCEKCPAYNYPDNAGKTCITDDGKCSTKQILTIEGRCQDCPTYNYPDVLSLNCISDRTDCSSTQILESTGKCEDCPLFFYPNIDRVKCINDQEACTETQVLNLSGKCEKCPDYTYKGPKGIECVDDLLKCEQN